MQNVTSLLTDTNKFLDPPLKLQDFQSTTKICRGFFQMLIYINIKLQPDTCSRSSVRRLTILFSYIPYLYGFFIQQISALTHILIIKYPMKIILLQSIHLNYLFILCSRWDNKNHEVPTCSLCGPIFASCYRLLFLQLYSNC